MTRAGKGLAAAVFFALASGAQAQSVAVLGNQTFWRQHYTLMSPVVETDGNIEGTEFRGRWMGESSAPAPDGWTAPDFDDAGWLRMPAIDPDSPFVARVAMRARFSVADPQSISGLKLQATYKGGIIVTLNGVEVARRHLPAGTLGPDALAERYPQEAGADGLPRTLDNLEVPLRLLRRGVNVLGIELVRAPYRPADIIPPSGRGLPTIDVGLCGLVDVRLTASNGDGLTPNVVRPPGFQLWNSDVLMPDFDVDFGDPNEPVQPIRIVAVRGGSFSGKVVAGSTEPILNLRAETGDWLRKDGSGRIAESSVQIRYALPGGGEMEANRRYTVLPNRFDGLAETAPAEIPVYDKPPTRHWRYPNRTLPEEPPAVPGAVQPIWITVHVPRDAEPGVYEGMLAVAQDGAAAVNVPIRLEVGSWTLPEPAAFGTLAELVQSPETIAMQYETPLWSEAHFEKIIPSLKLLRRAGSDTTHIFLISDTNQGNDETMVRWIRQADGSFKHDFTVMERYLDLVEAHQGRPNVICLYVWDTYLEGGLVREGGDRGGFGGTQSIAEREAHEGWGPIVSLLDPATGTTEKHVLPEYRDPQSLSLWKPVIDGVLHRLRARGYDAQIMLGISSDNRPTLEVVDLFRTLAPGVRWVSHAHPVQTEIHGTSTGFASGVWILRRPEYPVDQPENRNHGWQREDWVVHNPRGARDTDLMTRWLFMAEMRITGGLRGFCRLGADFWPVDRVQGPRGRLQARSLSARFPKTIWGNLNMETCLFAPGPRGALSTARYEMLVEGIQAVEARIALERVLADDGLRAGLDHDALERIRGILEDRILAMRRGASSLVQTGPWYAHAGASEGGALGSLWFVMSDWQDNLAALYDAASSMDAAK